MSWILGFRSWLRGFHCLEGGMVLPVSFTCTQGMWVIHLKELLYWEACKILLPGKVEPHSIPFRGMEMLYLFVMSHSTQEVFHPSGLQVLLKYQWLHRLPHILQPVGIPKASRLNWLSSKSPEAWLQSGNLVSKGNYWCYIAWLKYIFFPHIKIVSSLLDQVHFLKCASNNGK